MKQWKKFVDFIDWVAGLKERRVPQMMVAGLGFFGLGAGALFIFMYQKFLDSSSLQYVVNFIPPAVWGIMYFGMGAVLLTCAWIDFTKAVVPSLTYSFIFLFFGVMNIFDFFEGPATGIVSGLSFLGFWFAVCTAFMCVAPITAKRIREVNNNEAT